MNVQKQLYQKLTKSTDDWVIDAYYATHSSGLTYWVANGLAFFYPSESKSKSLGYLINLSFYYRIKLYFWLLNAARLQLLAKIK